MLFDLKTNQVVYQRSADLWPRFLRLQELVLCDLYMNQTLDLPVVWWPVTQFWGHRSLCIVIWMWIRLYQWTDHLWPSLEVTEACSVWFRCESDFSSGRMTCDPIYRSLKPAQCDLMWIRLYLWSDHLWPLLEVIGACAVQCGHETDFTSELITCDPV